MTQNRNPSFGLGAVMNFSSTSRITKTSKSLIDVLLTSHAECYATSGSLHLGLSDHDLIFTVRKKKNLWSKPPLIEFRSMKNFKLPDFLAYLKGSHGLRPTHSITPMMYGLIGEHFSDFLDQQVPLKEKWIRGDQLP